MQHTNITIKIGEQAYHPDQHQHINEVAMNMPACAMHTVTHNNQGDFHTYQISMLMRAETDAELEQAKQTLDNRLSGILVEDGFMRISERVLNNCDFITA